MAAPVLYLNKQSSLSNTSRRKSPRRKTSASIQSATATFRPNAGYRNAA